MPDPHTYPSSQMASMPPDFETQFTTECNLDETHSDVDIPDAHETNASPFSLPAPFTLGQGWDFSDVAETVEGSADGEQSQIDIFQGISLFGDGGEMEERVPETPPFSTENGTHPSTTSPALGEAGPVSHVYDLPPSPFELDPMLDPRLGTQIPSSLSPYEYYGSAEDNEEWVGGEVDRDGSVQSGSETPEDFPRGHAKYELRDRDKAVVTTHLDWDKSGNYNPEEEGRRPKKPNGVERNGSRKRRSGPHEDNQLDENRQPRQKKAKVYSLAYARLIGASFILTVNMKSEAGKQLAAKYQGDDNWPDESYNFVSDEYLAQNLVESDNEDGEGGDELGSSGRRRKLLRPRKRHVRYRSPCFDDELLPPIADPLGIHDDLRNHPAARGCIECRLDGKSCSLRKSDATWPCLECQEKHAGEDFVQCELVVPPTKKTACEACVEADKECSYDDPDANCGVACRQCAEAHLTCMAGPDLDSLPRRTTYTPPPGVTYTPYRPFVACTACRQVKRSCSLKSKQDNPPCRACEKAGIPCTFEKLIPTNAGKQKASPKATVPEDSPVRPPKASVGGISAPAPSTFRLPLRTASKTSTGSQTHIYSSSAAHRAATHSAKTPGSRPGGLTTITPPSKLRQLPLTSLSTMSTVSNPRHTTGSSTGITSFRSGARTATDVAFTRHLQQQKLAQSGNTLRQRQRQRQQQQQQQQQNRNPDRVTHINPSSTLHHGPSATQDYQPPEDAPDIPAAYHVLPPPGVHARDTMTDAAGRVGYYREIVTALAHPVVFDLSPHNNNRNEQGDLSSTSCRFCLHPAFAIHGLSWKKAAVMAWRDGRGFTEIAGGHASSMPGGVGSVEPARMCRACVLRRVDVLSCAAAHADMEAC
ncbi:putative c6 zinc finger domain protein [Diplodia seriata]|uniref:Putative c6 zinc finger domain protein n=1 Tax=Diplodia seriata TaxID=420778 RepID=A0A0G2E9C1_9PEZI|nr:putative c6 zinc finger domain protein [Diplodia seriata]